MTADATPLHVVRDLPEPGNGPALLEAGLDAAYQPIVHLGSGSVIAYEALARPRHPDARNPLAFFDALERSGLRLAGERTAFAAALRGAEAGLPRVKLFMNASPGTLVDASFDVLELLELAERHRIAASDLVIEVTESEEIDDIEALALRIRRLRRLGVGVAVDDAGAGHASFRVITRLRPSFIKLDRDLVAGVDSDGARHAFIEAMVRFSRQIGSRLIAEGIETEGELACLAGLGVEAGQGYFLGRPQIGEFADPSADSTRLIGVAARRLQLGAARLSIAELARPATRLHAGATVRDAYDRFTAEPGLALLLLADATDDATQVSRRALERALAAPGAWDHLVDRDVRAVADHDPLTVRAELDVAEVGAILAARPSRDDAEEVVVTDAGGGVVGVVGVAAVLRALVEVHRQRPDELNPLSGLPGATWAEAELQRRLIAGHDVAVAVLDVDGFRTLNHHGGFALGDQAIRAIPRCLTGVAAGVPDAAVAHAGGDDFVIIVPPRGVEELVGELVRSVESEVMPLLRTELRIRGAYDGGTLGVSMASVDVPAATAPSSDVLGVVREQLAGLLRVAKAEAGYAVVRAGVEPETLHLSTWEARGGRRHIALGLAEPQVVLDALALVDRAWGAWWADDDDGTGIGSEGFPGPRAVVERLLATYGGPLRAQAEEALHQRRPVFEVTISGPEHELLEMLDRLAIVARAAYRGGRAPASPEVALLERLLRQRARAVTRRDTTRAATALSRLVTG
jgi:EAL domain-containing protein (putative c-di-GMP-specific phosphodiesterase class I)/GGDEF domain-containing protein